MPINLTEQLHHVFMYHSSISDARNIYNYYVHLKEHWQGKHHYLPCSGDLGLSSSDFPWFIPPSAAVSWPGFYHTSPELSVDIFCGHQSL